MASHMGLGYTVNMLRCTYKQVFMAMLVLLARLLVHLDYS